MNNDHNVMETNQDVMETTMEHPKATYFIEVVVAQLMKDVTIFQ